ncbi:MAG: 1-deoxy-D-xylulose-5-phosphate synthase [Acidimicrobiia bacterium]
MADSLLLDAIEGPEDLRRLNADQLAALAEEIRQFLIEAVSVSGGHLGSNLGAVELTLALHRVFDSPRDTIVWDTGHQAYVHKLVTGRRDGFARLRQGGGLSGYPNRAESEHDLVENSHASTAVSYAFGLAVARDAKQSGETVVAVIGDGALTGGMAYEGLNNFGFTGRRAVIVLNDNGRTYAPTVSHLSATGPGHDPAGDLSGFFTALGLGYVGPVDGHDIAALEPVLRDAAAADGPVVVHVITRKGEGYEPAETDEEKRLHDVGAFDPETGVPLGEKKVSYTAAFGDALIDLAAERPEIVAITAGMPGSTGLLGFAERFPDRCLDVGIAEQHAVTSATGMALKGLRPVVALYSTFLSRAWDQVLYDVGLHGAPVVFCLDRAGITGDDGPSHHGLYDMALLTKVPGMTIFAPSSYEEVRVMLDEALRTSNGPVALRWSKTPARHVDAGGTGSGRNARKLQEGEDVCFLAVGKMVAAAEEAAALLLARGVHATIYDVRVLPPDPRMIADARRHPLVVTVEDGVAEGGAGALLAGAIANEDVGKVGPPVVVLGTPNAFLAQGKPADILANLGLDGPGISATVLKALDLPAAE